MFKKLLLVIVFTIVASSSYAQVKLKGMIYDEYLEPFPGAQIQAIDAAVTSNIDGEFSLSTNAAFPVILNVSAFGFQSETIEVTDASKTINVILKENLLLDQVVISASRTPERILESPVTIERLGLSDIKKNTSNSFYDGLTNLKGVDAREISYGFKSVNTRGFSDFSNSRFVQLVDGMDTAAPALNFSAGNLSGVSELDINNVEILPGASSALYGANAYNGIMLMTTKNPFDFTGVSFLLKSGTTYQQAAGSNPFYDVTVRMAHKFSNAFAAKVNFSYFEAEEWHATDNRNKQIDTGKLIDGDRTSTTNYDGVNTYGDETITNLSALYGGYYQQLNGDPFILSRTGYTENELVEDYQSKNLKFSTSLHYRPLENESLEIILATRLAKGDNMFQGTTRFAQRDYYIGQSKLEVKGDNFYVRGYYTRNDAGNTYDLTRTGFGLTQASSRFSSFGSWTADFAEALFFYGADRNNITSDLGILQLSREFADSYRINPGTPEFKEEFDRITSTLVTEGGSGIYDTSSYTHADGNYNFRSLLNEWADVQVGFSYRQYNPNSKGTIFNDAEQAIQIEEHGFYSQIQKKFLDDRLKLTASMRYDKSQNFDGNYSPRFAVNYALGEDRNHILRASYQTGFRNPTMQEQYMLLPAGRKINVGASQDNLNRISIGENEFTLDGIEFFGAISGDDIINNSFLTRTVFPEDSGYTGTTFEKSTYKAITPEEVKTIELGYRSILGLSDSNNLSIDINGFYSIHNDFVFYQDIITPRFGTIYPNGNTVISDQEATDATNQGALVVDNVIVMDPLAAIAFGNGLNQEFNIITNSKSTVNSYGFGIGANTKFLGNFDFGVSYNFIDYTFEDEDFGLFEPNFNSPKHSAKLQIGNDKVLKNVGFNINARWSDKYRWVSPFVKGDVSARTVVDAQLNYRVPSIKSRFKIGGTNLFGKEYFVAPGTGTIGQLYYVSWTINN